MLFTCKRSLPLTLLVTTVFAALFWRCSSILELSWSWSLTGGQVLDLVVCLALLVTQDFGIHALPWFLFPGCYRPSYRALVEQFHGQGVAHFLASGALAATEELVFRGIVLEGIRTRTDLGTGVALIVSAALSGLAHWPRPRAIWIFAVFAVWEGLVLGAVYLYTGSLLLSMILHGVHDIAGYAFFAVERRRGVWLRSA